MRRFIGKYYYFIVTVFALFLAFLIVFHQRNLAFAKARLDLDDVAIKGELRNDDRMVLISRDRNNLKNYVKFRKNYRREMVEELPRPRPLAVDSGKQ